MTEADDYVAITRLQNAYGDVVTRRAWAELHEQFLPDAPVRVDTVTSPVVELAGPQEVGAFIGGAVERFEFFQFVPLNTVLDIDVAAGTARGRLYIWELRQDATTGQSSQAFGVYHDEYRKVDGRWMFASRHYQSLARTGRNEVFAFPKEPW
jgi:hypothetical protein